MLKATPYRPHVIEIKTRKHAPIDEKTLRHKYPTMATLIRRSDGKKFEEWTIASPYMAIDYALDGYRVVFDDGEPRL